MGSCAASSLGLHCLPISHKRDTRLICTLTLTVACLHLMKGNTQATHGKCVASSLGLHCLPMSHQKDARLICSLFLTYACFLCMKRNRQATHGKLCRI